MPRRRRPTSRSGPEPAQRSTLVETVEGLGRCEALPDHLATLTPAVEGHVHELLVKQGDPVKKGQPIVELDKAVARADLAEKTATRDGLKASLALLKSLPRPEERRANELAIEQAKVAVERAKAVADELRPLAAQSRGLRAAIVRRREGAWRRPGSSRRRPRPSSTSMMIGPRPEAVAEAEAQDQDGRRPGRLLQGPPRLPHHPLTDRRRARQPDLPPRPDDRRSAARSARWSIRGRSSRRSGSRPGRPRRSASGRPRGSGPRTTTSAIGRGRSDDRRRRGCRARSTFVGRVADPQTGNLPIRVLVENPRGTAHPRADRSG